MALINFSSNVTSPCPKTIVFDPIIVGEKKTKKDKELTENEPQNNTVVKEPTIDNTIVKEPAKDNNIKTKKQAYSIKGIVWCDLNGNNIKDEDDFLIEDVQVELYTYDNLEEPKRIVRTNSQGYYEFKDIEINYYYVRINVPEKYRLLNKGKDSYINNKTLLSDKIYNDKEGINIIIGLRKSFKISGIVFFDYDGTGTYEKIDSGISDITIDIYNENGELISSTITSKKNLIQGYYEFDNLSPGKYKIVFTKVEGLSTCKPIMIYYGSKANPKTNTITVNIKNRDVNSAFIGLYRK